jgi:hypothetical protein
MHVSGGQWNISLHILYAIKYNILNHMWFFLAINCFNTHITIGICAKILLSTFYSYMHMLSQMTSQKKSMEQTQDPQFSKCCCYGFRPCGMWPHVVGWVVLCFLRGTEPLTQQHSHITSHLNPQHVVTYTIRCLETHNPCFLRLSTNCVVILWSQELPNNNDKPISIIIYRWTMLFFLMRSDLFVQN